MPGERAQRRINTLLDEADAAISRNDWVTAAERARAVLAHQPSNEDGKHYLETALRGLDAAQASPAQAASKSHQRLPAAAQGPAVPAVSRLPAPSHPASFANGRYTVKKFLGEGGKKLVYLAHDTVLDRDVAFALIKTDDLDEAAKSRIVREAQAMGRLGDHPNIMPIHDLGREGDQPYMVLPLMAGDVGGVIEKAPEHRMPLDQALAIGKDVCRGLVFAHSKGIVHRDLKPGNVSLTSEGLAKISDFGLAVATDRSRLTREGMMVGTVAYMPPEQAMGGEITPKADLYSFGAMLYEMVTGRPPFLGDDDIAIIGQHINTPPVAPTWHRPDCPRPLDALIMRLLAKDLKQRPESAKDVLNALEGVSALPSPLKGEGPGVGESLNKDGTLPSPSQGEGQGGGQPGRSLDSMSSGVFVGRQKEMDQLRAALEEALSGHGRMVTLVGEPGIGKTRTAQELATYAGLRRCQVLWGRCYEGGGAPPYWPWVQAIRQYAQEREPDQLRKDMGSTASVIAEVVTEVKDRLPGLQPPPQLESPESARFRLFDSISAFLKGASRTQPIILVLDDLHWSDKPSLLLLEFVARELGNSRLLVVGTYRDMELNRKHPLSVTLGDLTKDRLFEKVLLRGLQKHDVERFIEMAAGVKPPSGLVDAVQTQTEGNPLFVTEVVRLLVQEGHLARQATPSPSTGEDSGEGDRGRAAARRHKTTTWTVRIPEGVKEVIGRRLDRLSERCNDVLTTAAVIGRRFSLAALVRLYSGASLSSASGGPSPAGRGRSIPSPSKGEGQGVGETAVPPLPVEDRLSEDRLLELMEEALGARIIEEVPPGPGRFQFTHALMQETLTSELSTTRKVRLHARIALALEEMYGKQAEERAAELVSHFAEADTVLGTEKLVKYSLLAGEQALGAYAYEGAVVHFQRGLATKGGDSADLDAAEMWSGLGRAQIAVLERHELQTAVGSLTRAFESFIALGRVDRALEIACFPVTPIGGVTKYADVLHRALDLAPRDSAQQSVLLSQYAAHLLLEQGDVEQAVECVGLALEIAERLADKRLELQAISATVSMTGRPTDRKEPNERRLALAREVGDQDEELHAEFGLAGYEALHGNPGGALEHARRLMELAERLRTRTGLENGLMFQALIAAAAGNWALARTHTDRMLDVTPGSAWALGTRIWVEYTTGNLDVGRQFLDQLLERMKAVRPGPSHWYAIPGLVIPRIHRIRQDAALLDVAESAAKVVANSRSVRSSFGRMGLLLIAVERAEADVPSECIAELDRYRGSLIYGGASADHALARLAVLLGDTRLAASRFGDALAFLRRANYRADLAWVLCDYADFLGDESLLSDRAFKMRDEALVIARELGMKPLTERILRRREILKA